MEKPELEQQAPPSSEGAPAIALTAIASINVILEQLTDVAKQSPTGFSPAIALTAIASINVILEQLTDVAKQSPTGFSPAELATSRQTILNLLNSLATLRSEASALLHATVAYAIDGRLLKQRDVASAAGVSLFTAQTWKKAVTCEGCTFPIEGTADTVLDLDERPVRHWHGQCWRIAGRTHGGVR